MVGTRFAFIKRNFVYLCLLFLTIASLFPFFILLVNSTRNHAQIQRGFSAIFGVSFFENLRKLLTDPNMPILRSLFNSVFVSCMAALLTTYFSAMTAYGIYMYRFKGRATAFKTILAIMMIPTQVSSLGFIQLLIKIKMIDTLAALYIPAIASPVVFFYMYQAMTATLSYSIVEAARIDGCPEFKTFNQIVLPLMKPAIAVQAIFAFVSSWNNYFIPALVINSKMKKTIPILIAQLRNADYQKFDMGQVYMIICLAIVPLIIVYLFLSRNIISGVSVGAVKE
ncbi:MULTISPECIES: carbohydrate ABC transporter permease [unclassified Treponema]|uniref:carbohydrate ABC transporter permease n=1 Tax=unclassified Treponema TaxID=2638727 RepID=UPI001B291E0C|nr:MULTISPECIES: carbohydrate ABC transporter permease [unclassified Treponema]MBO6219019.1 carbohydrate ABC transporter permease [Treponema sp.]MBQ8678855.1 carbohydrate ABC transporter permease [Treponema sp.]